MPTKPTTPYEIRVVWQHGDVVVQHHFDPTTPRFEVREDGDLRASFAATRAWQSERRTAIEAAAYLAGVTLPAPAPTAPSGPRAPRPVPQARITPLVAALAEIFQDENVARSPDDCLRSARWHVWEGAALGLTFFTEMEADILRGTNQRYFDFECEGREKVVIYTSH